MEAKGLFGLISTHRDGWRITVADLARHSRDGEGAVKSGLKELEHHGFVVRVRTRQDDGTLGGVVYVITDQPDVQSCRSHPEPGFPPVDEPTSADPPLAPAADELHPGIRLLLDIANSRPEFLLTARR
ncbi:hypothetical protein [Streptomyces sp. NPDC001604]|uniref:hypothetical protein n=1 Tax=Streptomyces sp. NPDC001604 TaxID=3364593 RepID=UPI0036A843F4